MKKEKFHLTGIVKKVVEDTCSIAVMATCAEEAVDLAYEALEGYPYIEIGKDVPYFYIDNRLTVHSDVLDVFIDGDEDNGPEDAT